MFKATWEKTSVTHQLPEGTINKMVSLVYPNKKLLSCALMAGGCANLNYKIQLEDENKPLIVRVYVRDKDAAYREEKLSNLLKETVPVPRTYSIGECEGYLFAITEFMPGIPLGDLLLGHAPYDLGAIMQEVGSILSKITAHTFPKAGFLSKELEVIPYPSCELIQCVQECLTHSTVLSVLGPCLILEIHKAIEHAQSLLPTDDCSHLVHGDFDPANILVAQMNGSWVVSGILDWEFSFSGSPLWDIANMLRYAHKMPPEFQSAFLKGMTSGRMTSEKMTLPQNWHKTIQYLNLFSLLDCLERSDPHKQPHRCADIRDLIKNILRE